MSAFFKILQTPWRAVKNLKLRWKLVLCFVVIMIINSTSGLLNISVIQKLGDLVNVTYDKALMSGTFAETAKFDFAKIDAEVKAALLASSNENFKSHLDQVANFDETLQDDLQVVADRALSERSASLVKDVRHEIENVKAFKDDVLKQKAASLANSTAQRGLDLWTKWDSNPTRGKIEKLLTTIYDDAAETGYRFRMDSEKRNAKNLKLTIWILSVSVIVSLFLSIVLSLSLLRPLNILFDACERIQAGDYSTRSKLRRLDEFGSLAKSFDSMLDTIEQKDKDMESLLSALPFGVFYFDQNGVISRQRSAATDQIFEGFGQIATIESFLHRFKGTAESATREVRDIVMSEQIPFDAATGLLAQSLVQTREAKEQNINLSYRDQRSADTKIARVIVIAEDVTARVVAQKQTIVAEERVRRISRASKDLESFREFQPDAIKYFDQSLLELKKGPAADFDELKRSLHSLKGLLGVYQFTSLGKTVHDVESSLATLDLTLPSTTELLGEKTETARTEFDGYCKDILDVLGLSRAEFIRQYDSRKIRTIESVARAHGQMEIVNLLEGLNRFPISKVMAKYVRYCATLCETLGDRWVDLSFVNADDGRVPEISYEEAQHLDAVMIHLLRNSLDHGIEPCEERTAAGKSDSGTISIRCERSLDSGLNFVIADDGRGIDAKRLAAKAVANGSWTEMKAQSATEQEKIELIFAAGVSTKEQATEISGRGVGMDAVRAYLESIGGRIDIRTTLGQGTEFVLFVPPIETVLRLKKTQAAASLAA